MSIAGAIRAEMAQRKISGRALCAECGIAPPLLSRYLNGKGEMSIKSLMKVLDVLGFELSIKRIT